MSKGKLTLFPLTFLIFRLCLVTEVVVADAPLADENSLSFQESPQVPQTSLPTDKDVAQYHSTSLIEEVIVTATRREVDVQSVPLSVHVITEEELTRLGATDFADYARTVPGLSFTHNSWGGDKQVLRGISSSAILPEVNPTTAFYLDEVPIMGSGGGPHYNIDPMLTDIERIEVLRGPQGTLFGSSAMGGAIRIITRKPDLSKFEGSFGVVLSSLYNAGEGYELFGMYNMPRDDGRAAVRIVGYHRDMGGFIDNLTTGVNNVNDNDTSGARISGTALLSDRVTLTGKIAYQDRKSMGTDIEEWEDGPRKQSRLPESIGDEWINNNVVIDAEFDWGMLLSSTSYLDRSMDLTLDLGPFIEAVFGFSNPLWTNIADDTKEFVQEVRLVSDSSGRFSWIAGAFYQNQDQDWFQEMPSPGFDAQTDGLATSAGAPDNLVIGLYNFTLEQLALYGEVSYAITDRLDFVAGVRWFNFDRNFTSNIVGLLSAENPLESGAASESGVTPKFSLGFAASENLTLYGLAAEGFRPGGISTPEGSNSPDCIAELATLGFSEFPTGYYSDSLWSYELGAKSRWLDGRAWLNVAIFHIDWSDMQTQKFLDCGIVFTQNAGDVSSDGIELAAALHPTDNVDITLAAGYTDAKLQTEVFSLGGNAGDRIPGVPRFTGSIGASYYFTGFDGRDAFIHGNYQYVSNSYNEFDTSIRHELPAYGIANFRTGLDGGKWAVTFFIDNVFDERGILVIEDDILRQSVTATPPRTVGIRTVWTF
jgi:iron complex outermembrane receptor protein